MRNHKFMNTGDLAGAMAAAPLSGDAGKAADNQVREALKGKTPKGDKGSKGNPLAAYFGAPTFVMNKRSKWYPSDDGKSKNMKHAEVHFTLGGTVEVAASIYEERTLIQGGNGRQWQQALRFSLPKAVSVAASMESHLEAWRMSMLIAYQTWAKANNVTVSAKSAPGTVSLGTIEEDGPTTEKK